MGYPHSQGRLRAGGCPPAGAGWHAVGWRARGRLAAGGLGWSTPPRHPRPLLGGWEAAGGRAAGGQGWLTHPPPLPCSPVPCWLGVAVGWG